MRLLRSSNSFLEPQGRHAGISKHCDVIEHWDFGGWTLNVAPYPWRYDYMFKSCYDYAAKFSCGDRVPIIVATGSAVDSGSAEAILDSECAFLDGGGLSLLPLLGHRSNSSDNSMVDTGLELDSGTVEGSHSIEPIENSCCTNEARGTARISEVSAIAVVSGWVEEAQHIEVMWSSLIAHGTLCLDELLTCTPCNSIFTSVLLPHHFDNTSRSADALINAIFEEVETKYIMNLCCAGIGDLIPCDSMSVQFVPGL